MLFLLLTCSEDDRSTDFIDNVEAPSNLSMNFTVTQDNTGTVTIAPNGVGATQFTIQLGDGSGQSVDLGVGESFDHIYAEGTYTVGLIAKAINGKTTETSQELVVSFQAPQNLMVTIENDEAISKQVNVTASAEFAVMFEVDFGDGSEPLTGNIDSTVSYVYADPGTYTITVTAMGAAIETTQYVEEFEVTAIQQPTASAPTPPDRAEADVISLYTEVYTNEPGTDFFPNWGQGDCCGSSWGTFDLNGDEMLQYTNISYQGNQLAAPIDVSEMEFVHFEVWTADVLQSIEFSLISVSNGERPVTVELTPNAWTSIDIPISDYTDQEGFTVTDIHQIKYVGTPFSGGGTAFIDNIYFYRAPSVQTQPIIPVGFESATFDYGIFSFGGPNFEPIPAGIINNPDPSGINTTEKVFELQKPSGAQVWAGAGINLAGGTDFSEGTTILVDVWSPTAGTPILYKMEDSSSPPDGNGNPSVVVEVLVNTTVANQWETLAFDLTTFGAFDPSNAYDRSIFFANFGNSGTGSTYYFDNIRISGATPPSPSIPLNFESSLFDYGAFSFGGANHAIIANPDMSGINTSGKVFEIVKTNGAQFFAGAGVNLAGATNFANGTTVTVDVWSPAAGTQILYKMEDSNSPPDGNGNPSVVVEVFVNTTVANQWETLSFDLTTFAAFDPNNSYDRVILFPDFGNDGVADETYYFDNIKLTN